MNTRSDGGPAFPIKETATECSFLGMSLRDYLAAKAMHAQLMTVAAPNDALEQVCIICYAIADAMLKAREL